MGLQSASSKLVWRPLSSAVRSNRSNDFQIVEHLLLQTPGNQIWQDLAPPLQIKFASKLTKHAGRPYV